MFLTGKRYIRAASSGIAGMKTNRDARREIKNFSRGTVDIKRFQGGGVSI